MALGGQADPDETYDFIASLYEADGFSFELQVTWLRRVVAPPRTCL